MEWRETASGRKRPEPLPTLPRPRAGFHPALSGGPFFAPPSLSSEYSPGGPEAIGTDFARANCHDTTDRTGDLSTRLPGHRRIERRTAAGATSREVARHTALRTRRPPRLSRSRPTDRRGRADRRGRGLRERHARGREGALAAIEPIPHRRRPRRVRPRSDRGAPPE